MLGVAKSLWYCGGYSQVSCAQQWTYCGMWHKSLVHRVDILWGVTPGRSGTGRGKSTHRWLRGHWGVCRVYLCILTHCAQLTHLHTVHTWHMYTLCTLRRVYPYTVCRLPDSVLRRTFVLRRTLDTLLLMHVDLHISEHCQHFKS